MFVLGEVTTIGNITDFYEGKTFIVQGQYYPRTCRLKQGVKQYKSKGIAENACKSLNEKVAHAGWNFEVINADEI